MAKNFSLKDLLSVDYTPGEPDLVKKNAKKRKQDIPTGNTAESVDVTEALTLMQRLKKARQMKRYQSRIEIGRERQSHRVADQGRLMRRARKAARNLIIKRLTQGKRKSDLPFQRRQELEKRLDKMPAAITRIAKKILPQVRKADRKKLAPKNDK